MEHLRQAPECRSKQHTHTQPQSSERVMLGREADGDTNGNTHSSLCRLRVAFSKDMAPKLRSEGRAVVYVGGGRERTFN